MQLITDFQLEPEGGRVSCQSDLENLQAHLSSMSSRLDYSPNIVQPISNAELVQTVFEMLDRDPSKRPSASGILWKLSWVPGEGLRENSCCSKGLVKLEAYVGG